jgi:hypothetical protein
MKRILGTAVLVSVLAAGLSCKDSVSTGPGTLHVRLTQPSQNSGLDTAIVFTITGPAALTSVSAPAGMRLFAQSLEGTTTRFALIGRLTGGATILNIGVVDVAATSQYSGSVEGVARPNYQLRPLGGYALAVTR